MLHPGAILPRDFYLQPTVDVARELLGKIVAVRQGETVLAGRIVETEAYLGARDEAAHSFRGKTARNAAMFGPAGHAYIFFSYGVHWMLNIVTQPVDVGEAVLVRAVEPLEGTETMRANLGYAADIPVHRYCNGPGKVAKAFGIDRARFDGADLCDASGHISIMDGVHSGSIGAIVTTTRIGITKAAAEPLRFYVAASPSVSRK